MAILKPAFATLLLLQVASCFTYPDCINGPLKNNGVCREGDDPAKRAAAMVAAMTIDEKLTNLNDNSQGASRLGLSAYDWWSEALHGVARSPGVNFSGQYDSATSFPTPLLTSAAFDDDLVEAIGRAIGIEARSFANGGHAGLNFFTPNINPFKDPRWGRGLETPGEDPFRISQYVKHLLQGMEWASQDPDSAGKRQLIATCKHYAAYDLERWNGTIRYYFDAIVSMQDLVEFYLPPFKQCARDSNVGSVMCSYNSVNGTPACANSYLMNTVLRDHWNWTKHNNFIASDCNAVHDIFADHKFVSDSAHAAAAAFNAGMDMSCEVNWPTNATGAYQEGLLSNATIDQALRRQYEGLIRADYWGKSNSSYPRNYGLSNINTASAQQLALKAATNGMVLLKNDGTLPLSFESKSVAMVGFWANDTADRMLGNYFGTPPFYRTPVYAAQQLGLRVNYANGSVSDGNYTAGIIDAAKKSDIILYFGGIDTSIETEDKDRTTIVWPDSQLSILQSLSALSKPLVVVQMGSSIDNTALLSNKGISAILWAAYPGMNGGTAVLNVLSGKNAPAGRLPITQYPSSYVDKVPMTDMTLRPSSSNPGRTYKWYDGAVQKFGYGLHYTTFQVKFSDTTNQTFQTKNLLSNCKETHGDLCPLHTFTLQIKNTGKTTSDFVALAFVNTTAGPPPHPLKELAAYKRVSSIAPGKSVNVALNFTVGNVARINTSGDTVVYAGEYCVSVDVPEQQKLCFEISGDDLVVDVWPQPKSG